jgi:hypothetical protein
MKYLGSNGFEFLKKAISNITELNHVFTLERDLIMLLTDALL